MLQLQPYGRRWTQQASRTCRAGATSFLHCKRSFSTLVHAPACWLWPGRVPAPRRCASMVHTKASCMSCTRPFGRSREGGVEPADAEYVIGSLLCPDGLVACRCGSTEKDALLDTVAALPRIDCRVLFTDRPADYDGDVEVDRALSYPAHAQDALHLPIRIESTSGEKVTPISALLRRALRPLALPEGDGRPIFRKSTVSTPKHEPVERNGRLHGRGASPAPCG